MSHIVSNSEVLDFLNVKKGYFEITAANDVMVLTSDEGGPCNIDIPDGSYEGADLATALQTAMNADSTLTGGTITFSVSYSSTTRKFTLDAGSGHTIAYSHSGSDAGLTLGFTDDHSAAQTITSDEEAGDPTAIVETIRDAVEGWVQDYCRRNFISQSYSEKYIGEKIISLDHYPVTDITRVAIGSIDVIKVCNTAEHTTATVGVTSTGLVLTKDGTADKTVLFDTYTTMTTLVAAINALGNSWSAGLMSSTYGSYKSNELLKRYGANCIDNNWVYLAIPDRAEDDFDVWTERGQIELSSTPSGFVYVDYTAGYSSDDMPENLKLAIKLLTSDVYSQRHNESFGLSSYSIGDIRQTLETTAMPKEVVDLLAVKAILGSLR